MLTLYYSNHLEYQKVMLLKLLESPLDDPFDPDIIMVQSPGMAQWVQQAIASERGISANIKFPMPSSYIWQLYRQVLSDISEFDYFSKDALIWQLMAILPQVLEEDREGIFSALQAYIDNDNQIVTASDKQLRLFRLSSTLADMFDQYLIYRPEWIEAWETHRESEITALIVQRLAKSGSSDAQKENLSKAIHWQSNLWRILLERLREKLGCTVLQQHRPALFKRFVEAIKTSPPENLPQRIFVFGISALPKILLDTLRLLGEHTDVHLFFNNPCRYYWGEITDEKHYKRLQLASYKNHFDQGAEHSLLSAEQQGNDYLNQIQSANSINEVYIPKDHPLLGSWGKLGRDFLYQLAELNVNSIEAFAPSLSNHLLAQLKNSILELEDPDNGSFTFHRDDHSISIHSCHSMLREVQVLHDNILSWFEDDVELEAKDIIVMVPNIDEYAPYIEAVFSAHAYNSLTKERSNRYIPFDIADRKVSENSQLATVFLELLALDKSEFEAQKIVELLEIESIQQRFELTMDDVELLTSWISSNEIRYGLNKEDGDKQLNFNAWRAGLERFLLGYAMHPAEGDWLNMTPFDRSYGLNAVLIGKLSEFIEALSYWHNEMKQAYPISVWKDKLVELLNSFFIQSEDNAATIIYLNEQIESVCQVPVNAQYSEKIAGSVIAELFSERLDDSHASLRFLSGKVNFCTLLPMRAIPFKVVALLGMNETDYPRQQVKNSFDLIQYLPQKGDRIRRDDDRYLFLEALLSAQQKFYVSYIGKTLIDDEHKLPSVLVSQLCEFLDTRTEREDSERKMIDLLTIHHSRNIFSDENFINESELTNQHSRSFAKEWIFNFNHLASENRVMDSFVEKVVDKTLYSNKTESTDNVEEIKKSINNLPLNEYKKIELHAWQLENFISSPLKYYFNQVLAVNLEDREEELADSETFKLDTLEEYLIKSEYMQQAETNWSELENQLKHRGILPRAEFANIELERVKTNIQPLYEAILPYQSQKPERQRALIELVDDENATVYHISATFEPLFNGQLVTWFTSSSKSKHHISLWLKYLLMVVSQNSTDVKPPLAFFNSKGSVQTISFTPIKTVKQAISQLRCWLRAYSCEKLQLVPSESYQELFNLINTQSTDDEKHRDSEQFTATKVLARIDNNNAYKYAKDFNYWQRVIQQSKEQDFDNLIETTKAWFSMLSEHLNENFDGHSERVESFKVS